VWGGFVGLLVGFYLRQRVQVEAAGGDGMEGRAEGQGREGRGLGVGEGGVTLWGGLSELLRVVVAGVTCVFRVCFCCLPARADVC
jgi:hypothetical protein